jgi:ABC-type branched-subunit amino acid transport system ATPase component
VTALLQVEGLSRHFGGVAALSKVSFSVPSGAIFGLIGPNGSGKTTLMNVISGVDRPSSGTVLLEGVPIQGLPAHVLARRGIARTFQHIRLVAELTAAQNVLLALHAPTAGPADILMRLPRLRRIEAKRHSQAVSLLEQAGVGELADARAGDLSYGDRRRVEIARALAAAPRLLLLDEPAAGMTQGERRALRSLIAGLPSRGVTVMLIEHDMDVVMDVCDQLQVLDQGRAIVSGKPEIVRSDPRVIEAYLGADDA